MNIWSITNGPYASITQFDFLDFRFIMLKDLGSEWDEVVLNKLIHDHKFIVPTHLVYKSFDVSHGRSLEPDPEYDTILQYLDNFKMLKCAERITSNELSHHEAMAVSAYYNSPHNEGVSMSVGDKVDGAHSGVIYVKNNRITHHQSLSWSTSPSSALELLGHTCIHNIDRDYMDSVIDLALTYDHSHEDHEMFRKNYVRMLKSYPDYDAWTKNKFQAQGEPIDSPVNSDPERKEIFTSEEEVMHSHALFVGGSHAIMNAVDYHRDVIKNNDDAVVLTGTAFTNPHFNRLVKNEINPRVWFAQHPTEHSSSHGIAIWKAMQMGWKPNIDKYNRKDFATNGMLHDFTGYSQVSHKAGNIDYDALREILNRNGEILCYLGHINGIISSADEPPYLCHKDFMQNYFTSKKGYNRLTHGAYSVELNGKSVQVYCPGGYATEKVDGLLKSMDEYFSFTPLPRTYSIKEKLADFEFLNCDAMLYLDNTSKPQVLYA